MKKSNKVNCKSNLCRLYADLIYDVFDTIVYMLFNLFSMFYRVSPVYLESFQVWSRLKSWRKKREERSKNWSLSPRNNRAEQSVGWSHQEQPDDCSRHLWKFPYLSMIYPNHLFSPLMSMAHPYKKPSLSLFCFYASFARDLNLFLDNCYCKGDGSSSWQRRSSWTLLIYLWIYMQYYSVIMSVSFCSMVE